MAAGVPATLYPSEGRGRRLAAIATILGGSRASIYRHLDTPSANLGEQATRGHGSGPYPVMTRIQMRAGLDLLPTWALEQKAAANRQVIAVMRQRLAAGEEVARMYQDPGLAWLERQADVAEDLVARRKRTAENRPGS